MRRYNPKELEPKWQKIWESDELYKADLNSSKPKYMAMSMFNYPSGAGIHIGHAMNYTISDVKARFKRQSGYESYHPIGWDAFGLPAENYAIKAGVSPQASMAKIIPDYHKQYKAMGWSNDWSKEIATHLPEYYKWTQWIFVQMYKNGLAYQDARMQWWCEQCQTVLANEQIVDGKCWRHDGPNDSEVKQKEVKQWFFKITEYADELLDAIDDLDWTDSVKTAQKNWIGKSKGAEISFAVDGQDIEVFTTRPDTIFGATFLVLAPEHELVAQITTEDQKKDVDEYVMLAQKKSELERMAEKDKTGVFTGAYATNPANNQRIPIWIADYILTGYGTGAIMAVPAHDERDHEFAKKYNLSEVQVVAPYTLYKGMSAPQPDKETLVRDIVDAIIRDNDDNYLLMIEGEHVHFVGGGIEPYDKDHESAIRREILEEVGYANIADIKKATCLMIAEGYRHTKDKNQICTGAFYEVTLANKDQVNSEIDQGLHIIKWVKKSEVSDLLTWEGHKIAWQQYITGSICYSGEGVMVNSGEYDGMDSAETRDNIVADLAQKGLASEKTNYKMRDWSVSRQRYWGAPIPIIYCPDDGIVLDENLPVELPILDDFQPSGDGRSALARATDWLNVKCPKCGAMGQRETDTLDTYICSSWYMLRYLDPHNDQQIFSTEIANKWMPVDFYNGGDHATAHMLYARFVTRFFTKIGLLENPEPFKQFLFNGKVRASDGTAFSKSKGNGVDPLEIISQGYGADALRTYLMFAAPLEFNANWDPQGVPGTYRFLNRLYTLVQEYLESDEIKLSPETAKQVLKSTHTMIKKTSEDIEENRYNTAISALMKCVNDLYKLKTGEFGKSDEWREALESTVACVAPFAPYVAEELWHDLGHETSVHKDSWPVHNDEYLSGDDMTIIVQINGKLRATISLAVDSTKDQVIAGTKADPKVAEYLKGQSIKREIYVPGKLVNFVV